jgi:hypothetical protein
MAERIKNDFFRDIIEIRKVDENRWIEWKTKRNLPLWEALGYLNIELSQMEKNGKEVLLPSGKIDRSEQSIQPYMIDPLKFYQEVESDCFPLNSLPISLNDIKSNRGEGRGVITQLYVRTHIAQFAFDTDPESIINQIDFRKIGKIIDPAHFQFARNEIPQYKDVLVTGIKILAKYNLSKSISELIADTLGRFDQVKIQQASEIYLSEKLKHLPEVK